MIQHTGNRQAHHGSPWWPGQSPVGPDRTETIPGPPAWCMVPDLAPGQSCVGPEDYRIYERGRVPGPGSDSSHRRRQGWPGITVPPNTSRSPGTVGTVRSPVPLLSPDRSDGGTTIYTEFKNRILCPSTRGGPGRRSSYPHGWGPDTPDPQMPSPAGQ